MSLPDTKETREARSSRTLVAVGRANPDRLALRCAWCERWFSADDRRLAGSGAPVSHGICGACESHHFGVCPREFGRMS